MVTAATTGRLVLSVIALFAVSGCGGPSDKSNTGASHVARTHEDIPAAPARKPSPASTPMLSATVGGGETSAQATTAKAGVEGAETLSCSADIGAAGAARRAAICRDVSPATHPPCNVANSCAMINDEIARSCALFDGKGEPMASCLSEPKPRAMAAAADVVRRYYSALNARDYDTAWSQWGDQGPPGKSRPAFEAGFARTLSTTVTIGALVPGSAGAGSIYQPVPVTVDAKLDDGRHQRFRGTYIVRRINDVDGATAEQLRWHIASASLAPVAAP